MKHSKKQTHLCFFHILFRSRAIFIKFMPYSTPMASTWWLREGEREEDIENIGFLLTFERLCVWCKNEIFLFILHHMTWMIKHLYFSYFSIYSLASPSVPSISPLFYFFWLFFLLLNRNFCCSSYIAML